MPRFLCEQLGEHLAERSCGRDDLVFTSPNGSPLRHRSFYRRAFKPAAKAAGLPDELRFHDLRHTCAALLIARGAHPRAIMERLGHSTITVTLNTYGHLFPSLDHRLMSPRRAGRAQCRGTPGARCQSVPIWERRMPMSSAPFTSWERFGKILVSLTVKRLYY